MKGEIWADRFFERVLDVVFWPWDAAKGKPVIVRLLAMTAGLLWVAPLFFLVAGPILIFIMVPLTLWELLK